MFKLSGAALIITACTYYGFYLSSNLYMRTRIIQSLITALHYIKAQIGYASSTLPDIFRDLSVNSDKVLFLSAEQTICQYNTGNCDHSSP